MTQFLLIPAEHQFLTPVLTFRHATDQCYRIHQNHKETTHPTAHIKQLFVDAIY